MRPIRPSRHRSWAVQVALQLQALVQGGLGVLVGLDGSLVGGRPQDLLPHQDHEHQQQLDDVAQEEQEGEGIGVERDDAGLRQDHPQRP